MSTAQHSPKRDHYLRAAIIVALSLLTPVSSFHARAFSPPGIITSVAKRQSSTPRPLSLSSSRLYAADTTTQSSSSSDNNNDDTTTLPIIPSDMRLREIQSELKERNISYADCFDRESLVKRLVEARDGLVQPTTPPPKKEEDDTPQVAETAAPTADDTTTAAEPITSPNDDNSNNTSEEEFDRESTLTNLRTLRVKELKIKLSALKVRWGTMIEKEEMVNALCNAMEDRFNKSKNFSRSGELIPGTVVDVEESVLMQELGWTKASDATPSSSSDDDGPSPHPPILLDVYATWCGPCQFLAPLLKEAAAELGPTVRVVKLDSDKYPQISSVLKVGGLPTLIRFDGGDISKEVQRIEGALTKDQLIDFANGDFRM
ncbi:hypothetical protein ACHAXR_011747 [Thalassiosira sp. AJA248-18]